MGGWPAARCSGRRFVRRRVVYTLACLRRLSWRVRAWAYLLCVFHGVSWFPCFFVWRFVFGGSPPLDAFTQLDLACLMASSPYACGDDLRRPPQRWEAPPPGTPLRHPHSQQRQPARAHAVEPALVAHAHTDRTQNTRVAVPRLPAPEDRRSGGGQRLTPDVPHNSGRPPYPGDGPPPAPRHAAPTGRAGQAR